MDLHLQSHAELTIESTHPDALLLSSSNPKKKSMARTCNLTYEQKALVIKKKSSDPTITQKNLAEWAQQEFGLDRPASQATISNIFKNTDKILNLAEDYRLLKRQRRLTCERLDMELAAWVKHEDKADCPDAIILKAQSLAEVYKSQDPSIAVPVFSNGWLQSFRQRHGFLPPSEKLSIRQYSSVVDDLFVLKKARRVLESLQLPTDVIDAAESKLCMPPVDG